MKTIIGYTDSVTECECCGKTNLKGTFCIDMDGVELYFGRVCAFKKHYTEADSNKIVSDVKWAEKTAVLACRKKGVTGDLTNLPVYNEEFKKALASVNLLKAA